MAEDTSEQKLIRYSKPFLMILRESPLVDAPEGLPPPEFFIERLKPDTKPKSKDRSDEDPERPASAKPAAPSRTPSAADKTIVFGPPKMMSFASSQQSAPNRLPDTDPKLSIGTRTTNPFARPKSTPLAQKRTSGDDEKEAVAPPSRSKPEGSLLSDKRPGMRDAESKGRKPDEFDREPSGSADSRLANSLRDRRRGPDADGKSPRRDGDKPGRPGQGERSGSGLKDASGKLSRDSDRLPSKNRADSSAGDSSNPDGKESAPVRDFANMRAPRPDNLAQRSGLQRLGGYDRPNLGGDRRRPRDATPEWMDEPKPEALEDGGVGSDPLKGGMFHSGEDVIQKFKAQMRIQERLSNKEPLKAGSSQAPATEEKNGAASSAQPAAPSSSNNALVDSTTSTSSLTEAATSSPKRASAGGLLGTETEEVVVQSIFSSGIDINGAQAEPRPNPGQGGSKFSKFFRRTDEGAAPATEPSPQHPAARSAQPPDAGTPIDFLQLLQNPRGLAPSAGLADLSRASPVPAQSRRLPSELPAGKRMMSEEDVLIAMGAYPKRSVADEGTVENAHSFKPPYSKDIKQDPAESIRNLLQNTQTKQLGPPALSSHPAQPDVPVSVSLGTESGAASLKSTILGGPSSLGQPYPTSQPPLRMMTEQDILQSLGAAQLPQQPSAPSARDDEQGFSRAMAMLARSNASQPPAIPSSNGASMHSGTPPPLSVNLPVNAMHQSRLLAESQTGPLSPGHPMQILSKGLPGSFPGPSQAGFHPQHNPMGPPPPRPYPSQFPSHGPHHHHQMLLEQQYLLASHGQIPGVDVGLVMRPPMQPSSMPPPQQSHMQGQHLPNQYGPSVSGAEDPSSQLAAMVQNSIKAKKIGQASAVSSSPMNVYKRMDVGSPGPEPRPGMMIPPGYFVPNFPGGVMNGRPFDQGSALPMGPRPPFMMDGPMPPMGPNQFVPPHPMMHGPMIPPHGPNGMIGNPPYPGGMPPSPYGAPSMGHPGHGK
ncbi:uncharacterized protein BJ171DRAFT_62244 [Polychytrium aggregatum]|uniref:uncharacterized protein n=1 Tax=Polychytrium aggregatum TaxID=110093 RepID=UPI0022FF0E96|nr:uncharacterized protein BJ171DRAFT_62244 [Polychytrium aggregatum]KAI9205514.1 hypothetical protein BJ171DRAFT_62244 [Polychytrium aggregatum]